MDASLTGGRRDYQQQQQKAKQQQEYYQQQQQQQQLQQQLHQPRNHSTQSQLQQQQHHHHHHLHRHQQQEPSHSYQHQYENHHQLQQHYQENDINNSYSSNSSGYDEEVCSTGTVSSATAAIYYGDNVPITYASNHSYNNNNDNDNDDDSVTSPSMQSPFPHFPPPPDYPPPSTPPLAASKQQQCSEYFEQNNTEYCGKSLSGGTVRGRNHSTPNRNGLFDNNSSAGSSGSSSNGGSGGCNNRKENNSNNLIGIYKNIKIPLRYSDNDSDRLEIFDRGGGGGGGGSNAKDRTKNNHQLLSSTSINKSYNRNVDKIDRRLFDCDASSTGSGSSSHNGGGSEKSLTLMERASGKNAKQQAGPQVKWIRNNIAATMEPFKPTKSTATTTLPRAHTERIYHQIDDTQLAGPSRPPPPNSMRALLLTANRNARPGSMRHMYTNRYGTQENIYEEISLEDRMRLLSGGHSMLSLNQSVSVEEEFRRVQNRHRRVLGELNLSVEAMLMPSTPPSESPVEEAVAHSSQASGTSRPTTNLDDDLDPASLAVGPTDELLSPVSAHTANIVGDMDSGFSGSSSSGGGASFVGSLRYRNGILNTRSLTPNDPCCNSSISGSGSSCRSSQRSNEDPGPITTTGRSTSVYAGGQPSGCHTMKPKAAEDPGPNYKESKSKISFWSRKGWKKIPGFSSNTSVHKTGLNNGKCNSIFSCDV